MGYTHYFSRKELKHSPELFKSFAEDVKTLLGNLPEHSFSSGGYGSEHLIKIAGGDGTEKALISDTLICFNGKNEDDEGGEDLSHESMWIEQNYEFGEGDYDNYQKKNFEDKGHLFSFCKTARKPYDLAVQGVIILYKQYFGARVEIASDGDADDWATAFELIDDIFKRETNGDSVEARFDDLTAKSCEENEMVI